MPKHSEQRTWDATSGANGGPPPSVHLEPPSGHLLSLSVILAPLSAWNSHVTRRVSVLWKFQVAPRAHSRETPSPNAA